MKKIFVSIFILLVAIVTMAYLYFSKLNSDHAQTDLSLYAATGSSGFIFSFENDKSILGILKEQDIFEEAIGNENFKALHSLENNLLALPTINQLIEKQTIYLNFIPGKKQHTDYLFSTQTGGNASQQQLYQTLKANVISLDTTANLAKITLKDSTVFYLGIKAQLILLSNAPDPVIKALGSNSEKADHKFIEYIKSNNRQTRNTLAQLYINFNKLPELLKNIIPGKLNGELAILDKQDSYAVLTYSFSNERVLFAGSTMTNDPNSYYHLFTEIPAQKITIDNILPESTATYSIYAIDNYASWRKGLKTWFINRKEDKKITKIQEEISTKYHLNPEELFPKYFSNQFVSAQLSTGEKLGAINLSNGDKLNQLLIDLSDPYDEDIKLFKEPDLLYAYFGTPLQSFKRPYYTIIDNYLVFANNASTLQSFLSNYKNNKLLINSIRYTNTSNQLPNTSNISFYIDLHNSSNLLRKNMATPYYRQLTAKDGLKEYETFVYQLSGDYGKFQTNILLNKTNNTLEDK